MKRHAILVLIILIAGCQTPSEPPVQEPTETSDVIPPEMVAVPGTSYEIAVDPVTNHQYEEFLEATRRTYPVIEDCPRGKGKDENYPWDDLLWTENHPPEGRDNYPVALVTKAEAEAYCEWISEELGREFQLPPREVFEKAMEGADFGKPGNLALAKLARHPDLEGTGIMWYPLTVAREYPGFRSDIGCYVQGASFSEWLTEGAGQGRGWISMDRVGDEERRYFLPMQGMGVRLCVLGFRLAARTNQ